MKIRIVTLSKGPERDLVSLEEDYRKRLSRSCPVEFVEIKRGDLGQGKSFERDWEKVRARTAKSFLILLDEKGKTFTSQALAHQMEKWFLGGRDVSFVIGGPEGFPENVKAEADMMLSLSSLTFPHKIVRLILVEALYRADDIRKGGPYHRE